MRATFVHTADNHLGYEQYGDKERYNDFARAFLAVVEDAIARQADFVVIAGDLFNKRAIDALTLMQAQNALQRLKDAGIPAIAIEGNHDRSYYRDGASWLQFLCWEGQLRLLNPKITDGAPELVAWDQETMCGACTDILREGEILRIYGLPWYGASTARVIEGFAAALARARTEEDAAGVRYRLLLLHTGVEGIVPNMHGLPTRAQFEPLRELVDYIALGHVHKPYAMDDWLYNPGSTETWSAEESAWDRGYYVTHVTTDAPAGQPRHEAELIHNPRRPFIRAQFQVDGLMTPASLYERFERFCEREARAHGITRPQPAGAEPVVDIGLVGVLSFAGEALERARLEAYAEAALHPLVVRLHDGTRDVDYDPSEDDGADGRDRATRQQFELHIFAELIGRDARFQPEAARWGQVLAEVKRMALDDEEPAAIAQRLRQARALLMPGA